MDPKRSATKQSPAPSLDTSPEQLLDAFKAAALSVTKLYKTSAAAQTSARRAGYQDCLEDLLSFLDRENIGLDDGEGWRIRSWATERLDGVSMAVSGDSEDEADKTDTSPAAAAYGPVPSMTPSSSSSSIPAHSTDTSRSAPSSSKRLELLPWDSSHVSRHPTPARDLPTTITVPTQEHFTFQLPQSSLHDPPNLATLDLSDAAIENAAANALPRQTRPHGGLSRSSAKQGVFGNLGTLGRGAGHKRKLNFAEIFDIDDLGAGRDMFGSNGSKRGRHE